MIVVLVLFLS
jgi:hypothetical protein